MTTTRQIPKTKCCLYNFEHIICHTECAPFDFETKRKGEKGDYNEDCAGSFDVHVTITSNKDSTIIQIFPEQHFPNGFSLAPNKFSLSSEEQLNQKKE